MQDMLHNSQNANRLFKGNYFFALQQLILRDIKKKYYKSVLGLLWAMLNPLLMMLIITIVFSSLFKHSIPDYPVYYLSGWLLFSFNTGSTTQSLHSMVDNGVLLRKIYLPKYLFVISQIAVNFVNLFFSLLSLAVVMLITGVPFTLYALLFPLPIILLVLYTTGLSLILSAYGVFFRDLNHLYGILVTAWGYATPLFYPVSIIPQKFLFLYELNPLYHYINIFRDLVYIGTMPSVRSIAIATCFSLLTLALGIVVFKNNQDRFYLHI